MKYRELIKMLEKQGWHQVRTTGSHMVYDHPDREDIVTVAGGGKLNRDIPPGTLRSIMRQAGLTRKGS